MRRVRMLLRDIQSVIINLYNIYVVLKRTSRIAN